MMITSIELFHIHTSVAGCWNGVFSFKSHPVEFQLGMVITLCACVCNYVLSFFVLFIIMCGLFFIARLESSFRTRFVCVMHGKC